MAGPETLQKSVVAGLLDIVLDLFDLRQDDLPFLFEFLGRETRGEGCLGHQRDGQTPVGGGHAAVDAHRVALRKAVGVTARALYGAPEGKRVPPEAALEKHMFGEMNEAPLIGGFVPGPYGEPDGESKAWRTPPAFG